jgi:hypothetical protein
MRKYLLFLLLTLATIKTSFALQLSTIGALDLGGKTYNEWWYTGVNPSFVGSAAANSDVKVTVDTTTYDAKADASGKWSVNTTVAAGDHSVSVVGDGTTYSFKLHLGQSMPSGTGVSTVPDTGSNQFVSIMFSLGVLLLASYFYFWGSQHTDKAKFEKYFLNS